MKILIKRASIVDAGHEFNKDAKDIFIEDGIIKAIEDEIVEKCDELIDQAYLSVAPGLFDVGVSIGEPGLEHREDLTSITAAAARGGFTGIACFPNVLPAIQSKSEVKYINRFSKDNLVEILPIGAITKDCEGKELAELYDMHQHGAVAFSDGQHSLQHPGVLKRALEYTKAFDGLVLNAPYDYQICKDGNMHEGKVSTTLGLRGIPRLSETLMLSRDLQLLEYTGGKLHVFNVSTAKSVAMIRTAKANGLRVTASVAALSLAYTDEALNSFDTNFKVLPPLREKEDQQALIEGLKDGTIDFINSNHVPLESELKEVEFPYAAFGASTIETTFAVAWKTLKRYASTEEIIAWLSHKPRQVLGLPPIKIEVNQPANLTLFQSGRLWKYKKERVETKSYNSPLLNQELLGRISGIVKGERYIEFWESE